MVRRARNRRLIGDRAFQDRPATVGSDRHVPNRPRTASATTAGTGPARARLIPRRHDLLPSAHRVLLTVDTSTGMQAPASGEQPPAGASRRVVCRTGGRDSVPDAAAAGLARERRTTSETRVRDRTDDAYVTGAGRGGDAGRRRVPPPRRSVGDVRSSGHTGAGPLGTVFHDSPYTIGWVENHGFALLVGLLFLAVAANDGRRFWHVFAIAVHVLLGAANLAFWSSFVAFGVVPMGIAATAAHVAFVVAQSICLRSARSRSTTWEVSS